MTAAQFRQLFPDAAGAKPKRPPKFKNKRCVVDGQKFDSQAQARRYLALRQLERAGQIAELAREVKYEFVVNGVVICGARFDFAYLENHRRVVEDVKGYINKKHPMFQVFQIKVRLLKALHGIDVRVTK